MFCYAVAYLIQKYFSRELVDFALKSVTVDVSNVALFLSFLFLFFKDFIYLLLDRGEEWEKERERNISVWLPLMRPLLGIWPATQACALTGNQTSAPLVHRPLLNPLSHTSQGCFYHF